MDGERLLFPPPRETIQERFVEFHSRNPHVFERFTAAARDLKRLGRRRYGAKAIYEHMRFHLALATDGDEFKLNNVWTSRYARLLVETFPGEFDGFLEMRRLQRE